MASKPEFDSRNRRRQTILRDLEAGYGGGPGRADPRAARSSCPAAVARKLIWEAMRRARVLPKVELHDPQWMMLLELFVAFEEGREVNVKTLSLVSQVPPTTASRHITHLERQGLIHRIPHPDDGRSFQFSLSNRTRDRIRAYLEELDRQWYVPAPPLVHH